MTRHGAALLLLVLSAGSAGGETIGDAPLDTLWLIRPPAYIANVARLERLNPRAKGVAWFDKRPCIIMTPAPPAEDSAETVLRRYLWLLNHELRHCRERRDFHGGAE